MSGIPVTLKVKDSILEALVQELRSAGYVVLEPDRVVAIGAGFSVRPDAPDFLIRVLTAKRRVSEEFGAQVAESPCTIWSERDEAALGLRIYTAQARLIKPLETPNVAH